MDTLLLWLAGWLDGCLLFGGPTLVGEGVIGGSSPSSRGFIGGVRMTVLRKSSGFNLRSSSSISSLPPNIGEDLLLVPCRHFLLGSGVEKFRLMRPLLVPEDGGANGREDGGALAPPDNGGDWRHTGVLPPLSGSVLIKRSLNPFLVSGKGAIECIAIAGTVAISPSGTSSHFLEFSFNALSTLDGESFTLFESKIVPSVSYGAAPFWSLARGSSTLPESACCWRRLSKYFLLNISLRCLSRLISKLVPFFLLRTQNLWYSLCLQRV